MKYLNTTIRPSLKSYWASWILFVFGIALVVGARPIGQILLEQAPNGAGQLNAVTPMVMAGAGALLSLYILIINIGISYFANRFYLTDDEVVEVYGIIKKERSSTKLDHVRKVGVKISIIGRILGYGDLQYHSSGTGGVDIEMKGIRNPEAIAAEAEELVQRRQNPEGENEDSERAGNTESAVDWSRIETLEKKVRELEGKNQEMAIRLARIEGGRDAIARSAPDSAGAAGHDTPRPQTESSPDTHEPSFAVEPSPEPGPSALESDEDDQWLGDGAPKMFPEDAPISTGSTSSPSSEAKTPEAEQDQPLDEPEQQSEASGDADSSDQDKASGKETGVDPGDSEAVGVLVRR